MKLQTSRTAHELHSERRTEERGSKSVRIQEPKVASVMASERPGPGLGTMARVGLEAQNPPAPRPSNIFKQMSAQRSKECYGISAQELIVISNTEQE